MAHRAGAWSRPTAALWRLALLITLTWGAVTLAGFVLVVLAVPVTRRFTTRRFWCVLGRHRLQRLCYEARLHTRAGRLPLVLWTRPTKVGERAHVLCRAGICAEDFDDNVGEIRAACFAREARVTHNPRWSHLVTIDIIRRDTLAASHNVGNPPAGCPAHRHHPAIDRPRPGRPTTHCSSTPDPGRQCSRGLPGACPVPLTPERRSPP